MGTISFEGMEFFAHHGYHQDEITRGNKFSVDLSFEVDMDAPAKTDDLKTALNYEKVYEAVKAQMATRSNLLEHAARRIVDGLREEFPTIKHIQLTLSKFNPPLKGIVHKVSVTVTA